MAMASTGLPSTWALPCRVSDLTNHGISGLAGCSEPMSSDLGEGQADSSRDTNMGHPASLPAPQGPESEAKEYPAVLPGIGLDTGATGPGIAARFLYSLSDAGWMNTILSAVCDTPRLYRIRSKIVV